MMMTFLCEHSYIILPASFHAAKKRVFFRIGGRLVLDLVAALDPVEPDYRFPVNIARFKGQTITIHTEPEIDFPLETSDSYPFAYDGKYRPLAHFTASRGWMNDPNGLVWHQGRYLMYFQHNPAATTWENMHWGLAESKDLIHWRELGDVLFPDETGTMFSGSGYVDTNNISGFGQDGEPPLLCFYTAAGDTSETSRNHTSDQCIAYSTDGGRTLIKYAGNPIIPQAAPLNRDPKIIPFPADNSFIIVMFLQDHEFALLKSYDLFHWQEIQRLTLPDDAECPDFYPLPDEHGCIHWVFSAASDYYLIGSFDGRHFTPESGAQRLNHGSASYAAQSWSELPDGRRIRTAFASAVIPGMPFGNCMDIPQEMSLHTVNGRLCLCAEPVSELSTLVTGTITRSSVPVSKDAPLSIHFPGKCCDIALTASCGDSFTISYASLTIEYNAVSGLLCCNGCEAPVRGIDGKVTLRIIIDTVFSEIFADAGSVYMGISSIQDASLDHLIITSDHTEIDHLTISKLKPFWE